ncbi:12,18-didecarboxysiroheme deacetylase [Candidatus Aminicenantes bacterium AC-708-M15]|jgi:12,18-didecarboxysiroheme deacetylase|nr:12,18-didecarboxysiroheme deacetylase [SCandidatus Aminicenantes bacterium Aminicenantia_JdfR_composite]MCP2604032.1 12,18-didecarboxysiroheme deacetylase [Candidatus Aminicenantes bacterium AC-708-M15]MCP2618337.1 12,18-didecarboxysiroheme deacetylase [Candidatus Aminicenantes bacterium AC-335-A11]
MIGISKLYCGTVEPSDVLRYGRKSKNLPSNLLQFSVDKKPIVVWNMTKTCNLHCIHCYSQSDYKRYEGELTTEQGKGLLRDLASFGVPVILFSGGEPLMREDIFELGKFAKELGLRVVISTNGTLITKEIAKKLKEIGVSYVGVSLDGMRETNDRFRGFRGAFDNALRGIQYCTELGIKVGLRFTINKRNFKDIPEMFRLVEEENIPRICFYHLVYTGRGSKLIEEDLSKEQTRQVVDLIIDKTYELHQKGKKVEVLTVDNHADGPYLYLRMKKEKNPRAEEVLELLKMNGGNSSGKGIGCISWNGDIHADQFWRHYSFGNVKERKFSEVWVDLSDPLMRKLKNRKPYLKGRCARCKWLDICNGNLRVRAEAKTGDVWNEDPACYLTEEEIGLQ